MASDFDFDRYAEKSAAGTSFALRLQELRNERGLTLDQLSSVVVCSRALLEEVEAGRLMPSLPMIARISRALGVSYTSLLHG